MLRLFSSRRLLPELRRCMSYTQSSNSSAYGGDGKTTVKILNQTEPNINLINTYSSHGFRLASNLFISGSIIVFPSHVFSWAVKRGVEITMDSLIVFDLIVPKVKILVIGYGSQDEPYDAKLPMALKKRGISCELLPTPNAVTTYNYLADDGLPVAGAFVPVKEEVKPEERDFEAISGHDYIFKGYNPRPPVGYERETMDELCERARELKGETTPQLKKPWRKDDDR